VGGLEQRWAQTEAVESRAQHARPAVDDEHVYVGGLGEDVYALSREDGSLAWVASRDGALSDSSPCCHGGRVYIGSGGGSVYAFDAADGSTVWRTATESAITASPLVRDGTVYVGRSDGAVLALDADDGSIGWSVDRQEPVHADLGYAPGGGLVFVATEAGTVAALEASTGAAIWDRSLAFDIDVSAPVVAENEVYVAASEVMGMRTDTGQSTLATNFYGANAGAAPAADDERLYIAGANGNVHAIEREGSLIRPGSDWTFETRETFVADPVVVDGRLVVASLGGTVYLLDGGRGEQLDAVELPTETRSTPVVVDGEVYIGSRSGAVFAFDTG
jgi:outer membrane protein assembly factor BamB